MNLSKRNFLIIIFKTLGIFSFFKFLKISKKITPPPPFSAVTLIKIPANASPSLDPDLMMGGVKRNENYWQKFKTIKSDFVKKKKLLYMTKIPSKEKGLFEIHSYWRSKECYMDFLKKIDTKTLEKDLLKNKVHILSRYPVVDMTFYVLTSYSNIKSL